MAGWQSLLKQVFKWEHHHEITGCFPANRVAAFSHPTMPSLRCQVARHGGKGKGHHRYSAAPLTVPNCWQHLGLAKKKTCPMEGNDGNMSENGDDIPTETIF